MLQLHVAGMKACAATIHPKIRAATTARRGMQTQIWLESALTGKILSPQKVRGVMGREPKSDKCKCDCEYCQYE